MRREFENRLSDECKRAQRHGELFSLLFLKIIFPKSTGAGNDRPYSERLTAVIKTVARTIKACVRGSDFLSRYGNDTFGIILPHTTVSGGEILAASCKKTYPGSKLRFPGARYAIHPPRDIRGTRPARSPKNWLPRL